MAKYASTCFRFTFVDCILSLRLHVLNYIKLRCSELNLGKKDYKCLDHLPMHVFT